MRKMPMALLLASCMAGLLFGPAADAAPGSGYTVVSTLDNPDASPGNNVCADLTGNCTLRAAVMEANAHVGPDTIMLAADTFLLTRTGVGENGASTGDLDLTGNVTLQGMGTGSTIIDATGLGDRIFEVLTGTTASLSQIGLRGAQLPTLSNYSGGGVRNWGTLTLTQVLITRNLVGSEAGQYGGGIDNQGPGVLKLNNSQVISNTALYGGGIFNLGQLMISSSQVVSNAAHELGGGVYNSGELAIVASQLLSNTADAGGGLLNYWSAEIANSTIAGNQGRLGAGLYNTGGGVLLTLTGSTVRDNHSTETGGGMLAASGVVTVTASLFTGNTSGETGAGFAMYNGEVRLANVTLVDNTTGINGGGISVLGGAFTAYNLTVAENTANAGHSGGTGAGIYVHIGTASLYNSVVAYNKLVYLDTPIAEDCNGTYGIFRYSLVQVTTGCAFTNENTLAGQDPLLLPLAANGGPTLTRALGPGSPLLDAADPAGCAAPGGGLLTTDQRGYARHVDGNSDGAARCDIGAFEAWLRLFLPLLQR